MSQSTLHLKGPAFDREVIDSPGVTVVDFWADWCGPCKALAPALDRLADEYAGRAKVAKVSIDEAPELAQRFDVRSIPTLIYFRDGQEVERSVGNVSYSQLQATLSRHAG